MPNESLEEVGSARLRIIVPHLDQIVFSPCQHEATICRKIRACDGSFVHSTELSQVSTFECGQTVDSDSLVFRYNYDLTIVLGELEAANDVTDDDLMLQDDRVRAVDHDACAIFAHDAKE